MNGKNLFLNRNLMPITKKVVRFYNCVTRRLLGDDLGDFILLEVVIGKCTPF